MNRARELRKHSTDAERLLWRHLRSRQVAGHKFRRQQPLGSFFVDFVCLEKRLIIELDGGQHNESAQAVYDSRRSEWLAHQGFSRNPVLGSRGFETGQCGQGTIEQALSES